LPVRGELKEERGVKVQFKRIGYECYLRWSPKRPKKKKLKKRSSGNAAREAPSVEERISN